MSGGDAGSAFAEVLAAADPSLAPFAVDPPPEGEWEARGAEGDRAFTMESVYEGFLLHYREPRAFTGMDPDLRLLAGDALYALGLERLAQAGDLDAVAELADLISACAQAQAEGRPGDTQALWEATLQHFSA
ncbi:MAG: hypothetical protein QOC77_255 [Thermoleophilaceae bacterium]|jgi:hypothetical protein|nr:hypothetical protein [Thermoleophilaceae bacterium]